MEEKLFELFKTVLDAHIQTKTVCSTFHSKSQGFYELLFDCFHEISEKNQDIELDTPADEEEAKQATYDSLVEAQKIIGKMIKADYGIGMDNLLRGLSDKLDFAIGDARAFIKEEEEEKPKVKSSLPR